MIQKIRTKDWIAQRVFKSDSDALGYVGIRSRQEALTWLSDGGIIVRTDCDVDMALSRVHPNDSKRPHSIEEYERHVALDQSTFE